MRVVREDCALAGLHDPHLHLQDDLGAGGRAIWPYAAGHLVAEERPVDYGFHPVFFADALRVLKQHRAFWISAIVRRDVYELHVSKLRGQAVAENSRKLFSRVLALGNVIELVYADAGEVWRRLGFFLISFVHSASAEGKQADAQRHKRYECCYFNKPLFHCETS